MISTKNFDKEIKAFMVGIETKNSNESEFIQAVYEVAQTIVPYMEKNKKYKQAIVLERMAEPERVFVFRVPWIDDHSKYQINRGFRVQMNSAIGPYKGGLRFHPSVNLSILKFLAFEQVFKNSLTTLPMGGGKGGSDFDPKGKSDNEVMRFCQSFMTELCKYIGADIDIPAGDIGVGGREIGYLFGQYKRIKNEFRGILTGKHINFGGSLIRPEATGYGCVYFSQEMLNLTGDSLEGKKCVISGSGNVAQYAVEKILELGGTVLTISDSSGFIYDKDGLDKKKLEFVKDLKNNRRGRINEYTKKFKKAEFHDHLRPWNVSCDLVFPCATQNELYELDAKHLVKNGCKGVFEGANMPCLPEAVDHFHKNRILFAPSKASNAGGVTTSGLEMSQNSLRIAWSREEVDTKLKAIMKGIHTSCEKYGRVDKDYVDYVKGANIAGFVKVADAMLAQGHV